MNETPKPRIYSKYYPKIGRSYWCVSHMPQPFRKYVHLYPLWQKAHEWTYKQNSKETEMKEELVKYTCDNCKNTVTLVNGAYAGTPVHHKWIRMYILLNPTDVQKAKVHFCCKNCAVAYLSK